MNDFVEDADRRQRTGLDETIFCASKSVEQVESIIVQLSEQGRRSLLTRLEPVQYHSLNIEVKAKIAYDEQSRTALIGETINRLRTGCVGIVSGGTSDAPTVAEVNMTLSYYGYKANVYQDVGVAGLWRLLAVIDELKELPVIVAVAGMDAALPTVLAGLVPSLVIAVPTSVGYGVAAGGTAALNSLLSSCAAGLVVVNIDNGFGAACAAVKMLNKLPR